MSKVKKVEKNPKEEEAPSRRASAEQALTSVGKEQALTSVGKDTTSTESTGTVIECLKGHTKLGNKCLPAVTMDTRKQPVSIHFIYQSFIGCLTCAYYLQL